MKLLIALMAMALGGASTALIVTIQNDPLAFSKLDARAAAARVTSLPLPEPAAVGATLAAEHRFFQLEEVTIVGHVSPPTPQRRVSAPPPEAAEVVEHTLLPAPCRDGEYRLLEPKRGVRLMCPGQSLK